jgi:hypothetical protein
MLTVIFLYASDFCRVLYWYLTLKLNTFSRYFPLFSLNLYLSPVINSSWLVEKTMVGNSNYTFIQALVRREQAMKKILHNVVNNISETDGDR